MEGLEIKEISFKDLNVDNVKFRLDDEFYLKKYLNAYKKIKSKPNKQIIDILEILSDFSANGSYENIAKNFTLLDEKDFAYMVRTTDLEKSDYTNNVKYVSEHSYHFLEKSKLFGGELLINKIGSPGRVYIMPDLGIPVSLGMNLFMLRISKESGFKEKYIWAFLNSDFGQKIIQRKVNGTVPLTIDKEAIKTLYIPNASLNFQFKIDELINNSEACFKKSQGIYTQAEILLLKTLGMADFTPSSEAVNIKSFKDSFAASGRLDAEYYQPKYEEVVAHIKAQAYQHLIDLVDIQKSVEPGSDAYCEDGEAGLPFLRVADYSKQGLTPPQKQLKSSYVSENWDKLNALKPRKNTILFSKDGSVGEAYCLTEDLEAVTSGAVLHLSVKNTDVLLPEYLTLALNSKLVKMQSERDAGGSIILHWRVSEIENVVVPLVNMAIQQQIADLVQQSFTLKAHSTHLLDVAKRAVEIAIEQDEAAAMAFIECEVNDDNE